MNEILASVVRHGPMVLFGWVLVDQAGIPLPAVPLLLVVGALVGTQQVSPWMAFGSAIAGCLAADGLWYTLGRRRGARVLSVLCRLTIEPDSCVRRVEDLFIAYGLRSLMVAKFLPGLNPIAAALSGVVQIHPGRFIVYEAAGALAWSAAWMGLGYVFTDLIEQIAPEASRLGGMSILVLLGFLAGYVTIKLSNAGAFFERCAWPGSAPKS
jgi:membrane protein DedA with SNARE-associated domain